MEFLDVCWGARHLDTSTALGVLVREKKTTWEHLFQWYSGELDILKDSD